MADTVSEGPDVEESQPAGNSELDELFNAASGWLVTENQQDGYRIAQVGEDSTVDGTDRDWLFVQHEPGEDAYLYDPKNKSKLQKAVKFFVADLLRAERHGKFFFHRNRWFNTVLIYGTIIALYPHKEKHALVVDDGTSHIVCLLSDDQMLEELKSETKAHSQEVERLYLCERDNPNLQVAQMMSRNAARLLGQIPSYKDLAVGDNVMVMGNLSEYFNKRYVFINKIQKDHEDSDTQVEHLSQVLSLYETAYRSGGENLYDK